MVQILTFLGDLIAKYFFLIVLVIVSARIISLLKTISGEPTAKGSLKMAKRNLGLTFKLLSEEGNVKKEAIEAYEEQLNLYEKACEASQDIISKANKQALLVKKKAEVKVLEAEEKGYEPSKIASIEAKAAEETEMILSEAEKEAKELVLSEEEILEMKKDLVSKAKKSFMKRLMNDLKTAGNGKVEFRQRYEYMPMAKVEFKIIGKLHAIKKMANPDIKWEETISEYMASRYQYLR